MGVVVKRNLNLSAGVGRWALLLGLGGLSAGMPQAEAHEPHICPPGIVDVPAPRMADHIEHEDLMAGVYSQMEIFIEGGEIAEVRFNQCDGMGRPATTGEGEKREPGQPLMTRASGPEANSCFGCHAQPRAGGHGDFVANSFNGAEGLDPITYSISPELTNERNTTGMFGAGYIELIAREMTADLHALRDDYAAQGYTGWVTLKTKGVSFRVKFDQGVVVDSKGIDTDLIVKPFGAGGTVASIRQFTVEAYNRHHGMQAEEAFDIYHGDPDFDEDGVTRELTIGDITTSVFWQAMLDRPVQETPENDADLPLIAEGQQLFAEVGCTSCHKATLTLNNRNFCEPGPYNPPEVFGDQTQQVCILLDYQKFQRSKHDRADTAFPADTPMDLPVLTDLKRHRMCDDPDEVADPIRELCNEQHPQGRPDVAGVSGTEYFLTADLWQVGESMPYGHHGRYPGLAPMILAHAGEARASRDAYAALSEDQQISVLKYLKSLKILDQVARLNDG